MIVKQADDGQYEVIAQDGTRRVLGRFPSHASAWRFIDRQTGEPINPAEKKSEWITDKILSGGGDA